MNDLEKYFRTNNERVMTKWSNYFDIYERHFSKFRNKEVTILEIGVGFGGSLQMWKSYFGEKATIIGIDIEPICKTAEEKQITVVIGSQSDRYFLKELIKNIPKVDILIDDGGHMMDQQIISFEELFSSIDENGLYLCEDLCTSYWKEFDGGYKRPGTFIEYSKNFIDQLNVQHSRDNNHTINYFSESVESIHYYNNVLVIEKGNKGKPQVVFSGTIKYD
ncbi:MAG: class I SAM-dependent methyltransferase [Bacteroidales bacterium]|nr:class I SAM-dependent methyltransferase [Bacteroidales bacterium]